MCRFVPSARPARLEAVLSAVTHPEVSCAKNESLTFGVAQHKHILSKARIKMAVGSFQQARCCDAVRRRRQLQGTKASSPSRFPAKPYGPGAKIAWCQSPPRGQVKTCRKFRSSRHDKTANSAPAAWTHNL